MVLEEILESGRHLRNICLKKNIDINMEARKLQMATNKFDFIHQILELSIKLDTTIKNNDYLIELLGTEENEEEMKTLQIIRINFLLGFLSEAKEKILTISEAARLWGISRSTIYKAKEDNRLNENDYFGSKIKYSAMERVFGPIS